MNYCPLCGENMSDTEDRHHGCSVMSPHVPDETFGLAASVVGVAIADLESKWSVYLAGSVPGAVYGDFVVDGSFDPL